MASGTGLTEMLQTEIFAGNTVGHALRFTGGVLATFLVARVLQAIFRGHLKRLAERSKTRLDDIVVATFERPIYWIALAVGLDLSLGLLALPAGLLAFAGNVTTMVVTLFIAWSASNFVTQIRTTYVDPITARSESKLDDQVVPIIEKGLKVAVWSLAILIAVSNMGYDIVSVLTGLGIGGLALAMAAKDTLSNVFGSVTIFADRPFQVGDVVTLAGYTGTVKEVGLRTCRLETFEATQVTIPNASLVGGAIENLSARPARRFLGTIGLVYSTPIEELRAAMAALREILAAHAKVRDDFAVRLANFGDSALEVSVLYWVVPPDDYFDVVSEINLAIKERFDAAGWEMAFPSMTIYRGDSEPQPAPEPAAHTAVN